MSYAVIENDIIVNVVESQTDYAATQGWVLLEEEFGIGDEYRDGVFIKRQVDGNE